MPVPSDPSWQIVNDDGCPHWVYSQSSGNICGRMLVPEAGPPPNDPRCPPTFDETECGHSCMFGLSCNYPAQGAAMTCIGVGAGGDAGQSDSGTSWLCGI
jgi:hypothetical protein